MLYRIHDEERKIRFHYLQYYLRTTRSCLRMKNIGQSTSKSFEGKDFREISLRPFDDKEVSFEISHRLFHSEDISREISSRSFPHRAVCCLIPNRSCQVKETSLDSNSHMWLISSDVSLPRWKQKLTAHFLKMFLAYKEQSSSWILWLHSFTYGSE